MLAQFIESRMLAVELYLAPHGAVFVLHNLHGLDGGRNVVGKLSGIDQPLLVFPPHHVRDTRERQVGGFFKYTLRGQFTSRYPLFRRLSNGSLRGFVSNALLFRVPGGCTRYPTMACTPAVH